VVLVRGGWRMVMDGMMSFCAGYRIIQEAGVNSLQKIAAQRASLVFTFLRSLISERQSTFRSKISEI
jgi:hypothetical protein